MIGYFCYGYAGKRLSGLPVSQIYHQIVSPTITHFSVNSKFVTFCHYLKNSASFVEMEYLRGTVNMISKSRSGLARKSSYALLSNLPDELP